MSERLKEATLARLSSFLSKEIGMTFPRERWRDLERGVAAVAGEFGYASAEECAVRLPSSHLTRRQVETLAAFLTVGETYFFRDPRLFEVLEEEVLPEIISRRRGRERCLRLWSAGCSTGEEAYSLAILLHRLVHDPGGWRVTILATDINTAALAKGRSATYGNWSFRHAPSWLKERYFEKSGEGGYRVVEPVRRLVTFEYLNLAEDAYPSLYSNTNAMDVIMCRNVLMYFAPEMAQSVVVKLGRALVPNGWLAVSPTEHARVQTEPFVPVRFGGAVLYRKAEPHMEESGAGAAAAVGAVEAEPGPTAPPPLSSPPPTLETAEELYRKGECGEAARVLGELYGDAVMPVNAAVLLIRCHANRGALDEAISLCDKVLATEKLDPALHCLRAEILQEQGRVEEAVRALHRAIYLDPKLILAHLGLGNLYLWSGREATARKHFENALGELAVMAPDAVVPGSEGVTAARMREIIRYTVSGRVASFRGKA